MAREIPIITRDAYHKSYFKTEQKLNDRRDDITRHFELHKRCISKEALENHRLDFYLVFLTTGGEGIHTFGLKEHYITKNMLCFVSPEMITSWRSDTDEHQGYLCSFSEEFFNLGSTDSSFLSELPFYQIDGNSVLHLTEEQTAYYLSLFKLMDEDYVNKNEYADKVLRGLLHTLINKANSQYRMQECNTCAPNPPGIGLLRSFTRLFKNDFMPIRSGKAIEVKKISAYAHELGVSQNHLNDTIKAITGKSAGQLIKDQLIKQATMCLRQSTKSVSEIAYLLGYEDPSYFARYYKSQTGHAPSATRESQPV